MFWICHKTATGGEAPVQDNWGVWCTLSLPLLPDPLWLVVQLVPSMSQIDLFKNYSYSKGSSVKNSHQKCKYGCTMNAVS